MCTVQPRMPAADIARAALSMCRSMSAIVIRLHRQCMAAGARHVCAYAQAARTCCACSAALRTAFSSSATSTTTSRMSRPIFVARKCCGQSRGRLRREHRLWCEAQQGQALRGDEPEQSQCQAAVGLAGPSLRVERRSCVHTAWLISVPSCTLIRASCGHRYGVGRYVRRWCPPRGPSCSCSRPSGR
jgi:hypothetical protein